MILAERPKFMENEDWYDFDDKEYFVYVLTENAPKEVYDSYEQYLEDCVVCGKIGETIKDEILEKLQEKNIKELFGF